jgi:Polyketide cyclase / dehydrase and lipid transport
VKTALIVLGAVVVVVPALVFVLGALQPKEHVAEGSRSIAASIDTVAGWIRDVAGQSAWRPDLERVEVLATEPMLRYREVSSHGAITYRRREIEPGRQFESVIDDSKLEFGGRWLITLRPQNGDTVVTVREEGEVYSPVFRFFSRFVFGPEKTLNSYLDALAAHALSASR